MAIQPTYNHRKLAWWKAIFILLLPLQFHLEYISPLFLSQFQPVPGSFNVIQMQAQRGTKWAAVSWHSLLGKKKIQKLQTSVFQLLLTREEDVLIFANPSRSKIYLPLSPPNQRRLPPKECENEILVFLSIDTLRCQKAERHKAERHQKYMPAFVGIHHPWQKSGSGHCFLQNLLPFCHKNLNVLLFWYYKNQARWMIQCVTRYRNWFNARLLSH